MTHRKYDHNLDLDVRYRVRFDQDRGRIVDFVVQLEFARTDDAWVPVLRYDTAHGFAHQDSYRPDGSVKRHQPLGTGDYNVDLTFAVSDVLANWEQYVGPFRGHQS
jgi:hypothetical protein